MEIEHNEQYNNVVYGKLNDDLNEELNDDWIQKFEKTDNLYQDFYKDNLYYTNIHYIYVNRSNEIEKIKQDSFLFTVKNYITREELLGILKNNLVQENKQYSLLSILKYNITLEPSDINIFLNSINTFDNDYLTIVKNVDKIYFENSINMFHDLNDVLFIFYEKSNEIKLKNINNLTKKVYIYSNAKKNTIKKRYKE